MEDILLRLQSCTNEELRIIIDTAAARLVTPLYRCAACGDMVSSVKMCFLGMNEIPSETEQCCVCCARLCGACEEWYSPSRTRMHKDCIKVCVLCGQYNIRDPDCYCEMCKQRVSGRTSGYHTRG